MEFTVPLLVVFLLCGAVFVAGFIDSIAGGGGLISLPALLLAGIPAQNALGTNRFMSSVGTASAVYYFAKNKEIDWRLAAKGLPFSLSGAVLGTKFVLIMDPAVLNGVILFLLPIAAVICFIPIKEQKQRVKDQGLTFLIRIAVVCFLIGFYDGFFGPGTGTFLIMALHFFLGKGMVSASGTAKVFNLASNLGSMFTFMLSGKIIFLLAFPMALANMSGNLLGSRMAVKRGPDFIRKFIIIPLAMLFLALLVRFIGA